MNGPKIACAECGAVTDSIASPLCTPCAHRFVVEVALGGTVESAAGNARSAPASNDALKVIYDKIICSSTPDDPKLDVAYAIARYLKLDCPCAYEPQGVTDAMVEAALLSDETAPDRYRGIGVPGDEILMRDALEAAERARAAPPLLAQPSSNVVAFDLIGHLHRQREFSERTFGPGARANGVIDHIRRELAEIEADPVDLAEWVDVVLLALDGAWRSGAAPEEIAFAIAAKQTKNESRTWPDWRTSDPTKAIEHVRAPAEEVAR